MQNLKKCMPVPSKPLQPPAEDIQVLNDARNQSKHISYFNLYRYATWFEVLIICVGLGLAFLSAFGLIWAIIIYGEITTLFVDRSVENRTSSPAPIINLFGGGKILTNASREENSDTLIEDSIAYFYGSLAICAWQFLTAMFSVQCMNWTAQRQISRIRRLFLESVIRQDMSWFDTETNLNFATSVTDDLEKLKEGIGEKVAMFTFQIGSVVLSCIVSLVYGWELTLVALSVVPLSIIAAAIVSKFQMKYSNEELEAYSFAGRVVEEVLAGIKTVIAFGGEKKEIERYKERLGPAEVCGRKRGAATGLGGGFNWFLTYALNAIVFLYGTRLIVRDADLPPEDRIYIPGTMVMILFSIFSAVQNIAMCTPHTETFSAARGAAKGIFQLLDRKPAIDSLSPDGETPEELKGEIRLDNVDFNYPSRPEVKILRGLTLHIKPGETVALVGPSGCGKSTVLQLVQRLYDPAAGKVYIDEKPLKDINLGWLRTHIGVVGQEPVLFAGSIRDNIALGKDGATFEEIQRASKGAHAHDFIQNLANGYNTIIGERGAQLSGGQKQRIAIARSIIRDPRILLLDEATSALDLRSERKVQMALDKASVGRTTLVVSHRLSTIVNASRIVYIDRGAVAEEGTHEELLAKEGLYWKLVQTDMENQKVPPPALGACATLAEERGEGEWDEIVEVERAGAEGVELEAGLGGRGGKNRSSFVRESVSPERVWQESLRRAHRRSSISSVKSTGIPQVNPPVYEDVEPEQEDKGELSVTNWDLLKLNGPEWPLMVIGCIASLGVGITLPLFAVLFSQVYGMFAYSDSNLIISSSELYSGLFLAVAGLMGLATFIQIYVFTRAGVKLTSRLRVQTFESYLKQEMAWFDNPLNSVGALCARLSTDAASVQGATGSRLGTILQGVSTMLMGLLLAFANDWSMTLVSTLSVPLLIGGIYLEGHVTRKAQISERNAMEGASKIASEAIVNVRTVQSMGIERKIMSRYAESLEQAQAAGGDKSRLRGAVFGLGLTAPTLGYAISLTFGGYRIAYGGMPYKTAILISEALIYGSWMLGQALSFAPNFSSARNSGARVIAMMRRAPLIHDSPDAKDPQNWQANGEIQFKSVEFSYPSRRSAAGSEPVLRGLNLLVSPGKTVALVGHSGCGKSTCIQLLQRLYDAEHGSIEVDGKDVVESLPLRCLRSQLGIVQQEPVLFDKSIAENIAYGDNSREVDMDEIVKAATAANVHSFITGLPQGYETRLGTKGAQLSGGQKQRIAIARALVRNPRVLLLDEATSALDTQSEKLVQQALDSAKEGRTCIVIAHRLATIQNADAICVLERGRVAERGTHLELMQRRGLYYELHQTNA